MDIENPSESISGDDKDRFTCDMCSKTYSSKSNVTRHVKMCHNPKKRKKEKCCICFKKFSCLANLKTHMLLHDDSRDKHKCIYCEKEFMQKGNLQRHMELCRIRLQNDPELLENSKKFICNICETRFREKHHLQLHMYIHEEIYPYTCSICLNSFRQSSTLQTHEAMHTNEMHFYCTKCGQGFIRKDKVLENHCLKCFRDDDKQEYVRTVKVLNLKEFGGDDDNYDHYDDDYECDELFDNLL